MIIDKLKEWKYYEQKLPLYMKNSYGILEHFRILYELLLNVDSLEDNIIQSLDVFSNTYLEFINSLDGSDENVSDILDKLASLYGVSRNFGITYSNSGTPTYENLSLTNKELLKLIQARIIQNGYKGTYEESRKLYDKIGFGVYMLNTATPGYSYLYLDESIYMPTENERIMFLAGLFTLKSMGITYEMNVGELITLALWDSNDSTRMWDEGKWS